MKHNSLSSSHADFFRFKRVTNVAVSGDNSKVAYNTFSLKTAAKKRYWQNQLYLKTAADKTISLAKSATSITLPQWSFDGQNLAYLVKTKSQQQTSIWIFNVKKKTSYKLLTLSQDIYALKWSPNGNEIAFVSLDLDHVPQDPTKLIDVSKNYINLRLYAVATRQQKKPKVAALTAADYSVNIGSYGADFDWSPDGKSIAFAYQPRPDFQCVIQSKVAILNLATHRITKLPYTENHTGTNPNFSPDGKWLAFASNLAPVAYPQEAYREANNEIVHYRRFCVTNLAHMEQTHCLANTPSESPNIIGWEKDSKGIFVFDLYRTKGARIYFLSLDISASAKLISHFQERINHFSLSLNSSCTTFGFACETINNPPEAYVSAANQDSLQLQQVSRLANFPRRSLGQVEVIHWRSQDGAEIEGLLTKPANYDPKKKYPLYLMVHGAPHCWTEHYLGGCDEVWPRMFDPTTCFGAILRQGFIIFQPNFRGSTGYGKDFQMANVGDWGGKDYQDVMAGVDCLIKQGIADEAHMAVGGWSYGGFMTSFIIGHDARFKAAVAGVGVYNIISMFGTSDIPELLKKNLGCYFWDNFDLYWQRSPLAHVKDIHTPLLLLHGGDDMRSPASQSSELYQALRLQHKSVRMLIIPNEGHVPADPSRAWAAIEAVSEWLTKAL